MILITNIMAFAEGSDTVPLVTTAVNFNVLVEHELKVLSLLSGKASHGIPARSVRAQIDLGWLETAMFMLVAAVSLHGVGSGRFYC